MALCKIMGIVNVTPDSFFDGGVYADTRSAIERVYQLKEEGADLIDIGGESSRPGAVPVSAEEEMDRVCPVIEAVSKYIDVPLSIDTNKAGVARAALEAGATIVNDISGLTFDDAMAKVVAERRAGVIIMHMQGRPETMQVNPCYGDLVEEIRGFLNKAVQHALSSGIEKERIVVDPGIGFGKSVEDNYRIIGNIREFKKLGFPVLIGLSRKSLIGKLYNRDVDRLPATIALNMVSVLNGADIIRVHDVNEHRLALDSIEMLKRVS